MIYSWHYASYKSKLTGLILIKLEVYIKLFAINNILLKKNSVQFF